MKNFEQISTKPGFMKHNGGILFRNISENKYEFMTIINKNHLNVAGITHGGYLAALIDAGSGTAAYRVSNNTPCVTVTLEIKYIGASRTGDKIIGTVNIQKKTRSLIFLNCELKSEDKILASASGVWKILKVKTSNLGPGG